jgi:hypothetical protein
MPWNDGALSPCDHLKAQPLIASIWLQITARDKLSLALLRARLLLSGGSVAVYPVKYFAARDCAPAPNNLAAALLLTSFRNKDFASFFCCPDISA